MTAYIQASEIISIPQLSYEKISIKVVISIQYFLIPRTLIFMSSPWHTHLSTTGQIRVFSVDSTHSRQIYSLHSPTPPKYILLSLLSCNMVIVTLTLTLIYRETPSLSGNWVVVTPNLTLTNKPRETDK